MVWGVLFAAFGLVSVPALAHAPVNIKDYVRRDGYGRIKISPDGKYYAAMVQLKDRGGWRSFGAPTCRWSASSAPNCCSRPKPARCGVSRRASGEIR